MFKIIKLAFNTTLLVLAIIGFNAIGGQKYVENAKDIVTNCIQKHAQESAKKLGNFSDLHEEFQIDNTVNLLGYKAILAEHKASGQKMCIIDSGKKVLLTQEDIQNSELESKMQNLADKFKYQSVSLRDVRVVSKGQINVYGKTVPYARFEAKANKFPLSDLGGMVASVKTSDGSEKIILSVSESKKYSHLISEEFYKNVKEYN